MIKFFPSDLKFEFANIFLNKIFNFNENDDKYRFFPIRNGIPTDATSSLIDTEKILKHLNCYLECYFFTAMSSLDALAYEIFDKFNLEKLIKIYITTFDPEKAEKNTKIKKILEDLKKKDQDTLNIIQKFLIDDDFQIFKSYRDFIAHTSILSTELSFDLKQTIDEGAFYVLKRPLIIPRIINGSPNPNKNLHLTAWLRKFHEKIRIFHNEIKKIIIN